MQRLFKSVCEGRQWQRHMPTTSALRQLLIDPAFEKKVTLRVVLPI
jgi:hypothetical protein